MPSVKKHVLEMLMGCSFFVHASPAISLPDPNAKPASKQTTTSVRKSAQVPVQSTSSTAGKPSPLVTKLSPSPSKTNAVPIKKGVTSSSKTTSSAGKFAPVASKTQSSKSGFPTSSLTTAQSTTQINQQALLKPSDKTGKRALNGGVAKTKSHGLGRLLKEEFDGQIDPVSTDNKNF